MNRWAVAFVVVTGLATWAWAPQAWAQATPGVMNYQGTLLDSAGHLAQTGTYALQFQICDAATGGAIVWGPQILDGTAGVGHSSLVNVVDGAFNVILGPADTASRALTDAFDGSERYIEIAVEDPATKAYTWLAPRQQILSAPFAIKASNAGETDTVDGQHASDLTNASNQNAGTLSTDRFSALADLTAEGLLDSNADTDLVTRTQADARYVNEAQANSVTSTMIVDETVTSVDIADGTVISEIFDDDGVGSLLDADLLDGQEGAFYQDANNLNAGIVSTDRYSAATDLMVEGLLDDNAGADLVTRAQGDARYVEEGQADGVTSTMIVDGTVAAADIADGATLAEITDDDGVGSLLDADLLDGQHATFFQDASNLNAGTVAVDRFSAASDLAAEGLLDNNADADLLTRGQGDARYANEGQADSVTSAMIVDGTVAAADIADGATLAEVLDDDGVGSLLDADLLDGQEGAFYQNAGNVSAGTLATDRYSAYADLVAESKIGIGANLVSAGNHMVHGSTHTVSGTNAAVGGGYVNTASGNYATVAGGRSNTVSGDYTTVAGGTNGDATSAYATVGGGDGNEASDEYATVPGGDGNTASGYASAVGGGTANTASATYSAVPGGYGNEATGYMSFAAGNRAHSANMGTFVWADNTNTDFVSTADKQFLVRAAGGVGLGTASPSAQLHVAESVAGGGAIGDHAAIIDNTSTSSANGPDVLALRSNVSDPTSATNFITFFDADGAVGTIEGNGSGGIVFTSGSSDFAEYLPKRNTDEALEAGDLVGVHASGVSHETQGAQRVAVVTTAPLILGNAPGADEVGKHAPVAFLGQVPVKVRGQVHAGDYLVASGNDGTAKAMETVHAELLPLVAGQALESSQDVGVKKVRASVGVSRDGLWAQALHERDGRIATLEHELETLKAAVAALAAE